MNILQSDLVVASILTALAILSIILFVYILKKNKKEQGTIKPLTKTNQLIVVILVFVFFFSIIIGWIFWHGVKESYIYRPYLYSNDVSKCSRIITYDFAEIFGENLGAWNPKFAQLFFYQDCIENMAINNEDISICNKLAEIEDDKFGRFACITNYNKGQT